MIYMRRGFERFGRWWVPAVVIVSFTLGILDSENRLGYLSIIPAACSVMTSIGLVDALRNIRVDGYRRSFVYGLSFLLNASLFLFLLVCWAFRPK